MTTTAPNHDLKDAGAVGRIERLVEHLDRLAIESPETWSEVDLTIGQLRALLVLRHHQPMSVSAISLALHVSLGSGSALVDRLVRMRLVRRSEDPADRRVVLLELDEPGVAMLDRLVARRRAHLRATLERLSPTDRAVVARALRMLIETMRTTARPSPDEVPG
ncbi:MAG: MarR family winged helix-turn-helix transcriptional regulator [Candidatus Limnocylindrales bacterium]